MRVFVGIVVLLTFWSCETESKLEKEISNINIDLTVERFDQIFAESSSENFGDLKQNYPFLFSKHIPDSIYIARLEDSLQTVMYEELKSKFPQFAYDFNDIERLYQHLKYYDSNFKVPRVITVISDVDYRNKIVLTDTIALIALDTYLGKDHEFYANISKYISQNFEPEFIAVDLATEYGKKRIVNSGRKTLLADMIYYGKLLYFKDIMIPFRPDTEKIGYTQEQLDWALANEANIWSYFIENEMLFATDPKLTSRFINPAPFTKFRLEFDNESPGRLGQYIGWQIVRAYMNNNDVDLDAMLIASPKEIFDNSKFKPKK